MDSIRLLWVENLLLVALHLLYLVNTYTYNSTFVTTPAVIDFSIQNYTADIPVYITNNQGSGDGEVPEIDKNQPSCIYNIKSGSIECDSENLEGCPKIDAPQNVTTYLIKPKDIFAKINYADNKDDDFDFRNKLTQSCFNDMNELTHLSINFFGLCEIGNDTFQNLSLLQHLDLSYNCIVDIKPFKSFALPFLMTLNLSHNYISSLDPEYLNFPQLRYLNIENNKFISLKHGVFKLLPSLHVLVLNENDLNGLSSGSAFIGLDHLRKLHMKHCQLSSLSNLLFIHTQSVESLDLSYNKLSDIPSDAIGDLYFLQNLDLSSNMINDVPSQAFQGLALQTLDLSNNSIGTIAPLAFHSFSTEELYLQNNRIKAVPHKALEVLSRNLLVLDLSQNPLVGDQCVFPPELIYLQKLNLSKNDLPHIPSSIHQLYQLQTLDISKNHISNLNTSELKLIKRVDTVYLHGNPWICDCEIIGLREILVHKKKMLVIPSKQRTEMPPTGNLSSVKCARPANLARVSILAVPEHSLKECIGTWNKVTPIFLYIVYGLICLIIVTIIGFMWFKRKEMTYGRFCMDKSKDNYSTASGSQSPVKVISNTAAGATELAGKGPVKNQAWESALVISNPHSKLTPDDEEDDERETQTRNGKVPGAESIV